MVVYRTDSKSVDRQKPLLTKKNIQAHVTFAPETC